MIEERIYKYILRKKHIFKLRMLNVVITLNDIAYDLSLPSLKEIYLSLHYFCAFYSQCYYFLNPFFLA